MNTTVAEAWSLPLLPDQLTTLPGALAVLCLALASLWLLSPAGDQWSQLPGPPSPSWLLGHLPHVNTPAVHRFFQDNCQRYGMKGMYRIRMLHQKVVILSDPGLVQAVVSRKNELPKATEVYSGVDELFSPDGHPSFFSNPDQEEWKLVRKATAPAFSLDNIRKAFPGLMSVTNEICDVVAARLPGRQGEVDVAEFAMRITLDVIGAVGYGYDFKARTYAQHELLEAIPPLLAEYTLRATNPLRKMMHRVLPFLPVAALYNRNTKICHKWWETLLANVRATDLEAAAAAGDNSLRVCLARMTPDDAILRPNIAVYLIGGFETTAHSIAWALYEIASSPGVQARVEAELAGRGLLGPGARPLEFSDLAELRYLNCVLKESMRLHPVAAVGSIRKATCDMELGGYRLAKGTLLWIPFIALLTSKHNWERAEEFWPERWEAPEAAAPGVDNGQGPAATPLGHASNPTKSYLPFSDGPHDCIGQNLAMMEARAVLATVVGRYQLALAPRMGSREEVRAAEVMKLTLQCSKGIHLCFTPRQ